MFVWCSLVRHMYGPTTDVAKRVWRHNNMGPQTNLGGPTSVEWYFFNTPLRTFYLRDLHHVTNFSSKFVKILLFNKKSQWKKSCHAGHVASVVVNWAMPLAAHPRRGHEKTHTSQPRPYIAPLFPHTHTKKTPRHLAPRLHPRRCPSLRSPLGPRRHRSMQLPPPPPRVRAAPTPWSRHRHLQVRVVATPRRYIELILSPPIRGRSTW
jgi:hypothetical protein